MSQSKKMHFTDDMLEAIKQQKKFVAVRYGLRGDPHDDVRISPIAHTLHKIKHIEETYTEELVSKEFDAFSIVAWAAGDTFAELEAQLYES